MALLAALSAGVSIVSGISSMFAANKAQDKADALNAEALSTQREGLATAKMQLEDWKSTYGVVEKQLSDYYVTNNGQMQMDSAANMIESTFRGVPADITRTAAQRGLGEGQTAAMLSDALVQKAESKASARLGAGTAFRSERAGFVASGQGAKSQATSGILNGYNQMAQMLGGQGQNQQAIADKASAAAGQSLSSGMALLSQLGGG